MPKNGLITPDDSNDSARCLRKNLRTVATKAGPLLLPNSFPPCCPPSFHKLRKSLSSSSGESALFLCTLRCSCPSLSLCPPCSHCGRNFGPSLSRHSSVPA